MPTRETQTYKIRTDQGIFEVEGYLATIPGHPEVQVFTRYVTVGKLFDCRWCVTEVKTGRAISRGHKTEARALEDAEDSLDRVGLSALVGAIRSRGIGEDEAVERPDVTWKGL